MNITFEYNPLWILACVAISAAYALFFYYRNKANKNYSRTQKQILASLRFVTILSLSLLLLNPLLESYENQTEKPKLIIGVDASESVWLSDSLGTKKFYEELENTIPKLEADFDIIPLSFGAEIAELNSVFQQKESDYELFYSTIDKQFGGSNIAAIVLAGDGNFNTGADPIYIEKTKQFPNYTIALGDTAHHSDLRIENIELNKVAFLGNRFPLKFGLIGSYIPKEPIEIRVLSEGKEVYVNTFIPSSNNYSKKIELAIEATTPGTQSIQIEISPIANEKNTSNNTHQLFIEVIDNKKRILITGKAPHPDVKAMRVVLESQENYEVDVHMKASTLEELKPYHLVIFMNLNRDQYKLVNELKSSKIPAIYICGISTSFVAFKKANLGITLDQHNGQSNEVAPVLNRSFTYFKLNDKLEQSMRVWPSLLSNFGNYRLTQEGKSILYQKVGSVETEIPLFTFFQEKDYKWATIVGEGFFKWPIQEKVTQSPSGFQEFFLKSAQFVLLQEDKRRFRINSPQSVFENEALKFEASLYNASFEPLLEEEILISLTDSTNKEYIYSFTPNNINYTLNAGRLPSGMYQYSAEVKDSDEPPIKGKILVKPLNKEAMQVTTNLDLLKSLSQESGGKLYYPNQLEELMSDINSSDKFKSIIHSKLNYNSLVNQNWIFVLIILSLTLEWAARKYWGGI